jgi:hypothetical protein
MKAGTILLSQIGSTKTVAALAVGAPAAALFPGLLLVRGRMTKGGFQMSKLRITRRVRRNGSQRRDPGVRRAEAEG